MMNVSRMRAVALTAALIASSWNSVATAMSCSCTHQGASVYCPANLPPGSRSVQFVTGGTMWITTQDQQVFVPQATFTPCTTTTPPPTVPPVPPPPVDTPKAPPVETPKAPPVTTPPTPPTPPVQTPSTPSSPPPSSPPVTTPRTPPVQTPSTPVQTPSTPPVETPRSPPAQPSTQGPTLPPPSGRIQEDRARQLIEPRPPIVIPPPAGDDGKATDDAIRRMGEELRTKEKDTPPPPPVQPTTPPPPQTPKTTDKPDGKVPPDSVASEDCPQRGKGCVALIIDYSKKTWTEADFSGVATDTRKAGCSTKYVTPEFKPVPAPYWVEVFDVNQLSPGGGFYSPPKKKVKIQPDPAAVAEAKQHNDGQWKQIENAAESHHALVMLGVEMAIELINGHGGSFDDGKGGTCGVVGTDIPGIYTSRGTFHSGNYAAANKNVCSWLTADFTCTSGLTPRAADELNNTGAASCKGLVSSTNNCGLHAGYESDVSVGASTAEETCSQGDVVLFRGDLVKMIDKTGGGFKAKLHEGTIWSLPSHYSDRGYKYCDPHSRLGY